MSGFLLTDQERQRFIEYLEMEADSNDQMAGHLERIGGPAMLAVANMHRGESNALRIVAKRLKSIESITVAPKET